MNIEKGTIVKIKPTCHVMEVRGFVLPVDGFEWMIGLAQIRIKWKHDWGSEGKGEFIYLFFDEVEIVNDSPNPKV